mgnify:CR=1 FL=1
MSKLTNLQLKEEFLAMKEYHLGDYKFLSDFISNKVGISLNSKKLLNISKGGNNIYKEMGCWGGLRAKQYPDELAQFLVFIYGNRKNIKSYCEIGIGDGGTFFVIDSFLRALNVDMGRSTAIDIKDKCRKSFDIYIDQNPQVDFLNIDSDSFVPPINYDLSFIDGGHSLKQVSKDYIKMKRCSKYIALHDIYLESGGVRYLWQKIDSEKKEFLNKNINFPVPLGIGIVKGDIDEESLQ